MQRTAQLLNKPAALFLFSSISTCIFLPACADKKLRASAL